jgi:cell wall-associated NlpC family hydrolase
MPETAVLRTQPYAKGSHVAEVEALFANLYRETNITTHRPVITIPFESRLEVIGEPQGDGRWIQVRLPDDRSAWIQAGDVTLTPRNNVGIAELIEWSKRFLGLPYLWGGTSTYGYDCSGFTQMLCRRRGYSMPRDAGPQAQWEGVKPIEKTDLQPGDLLYFGSSPQHITHTGMYIGNGQFINATAYQHPVVQIDDLNEEHWTKLLVAAARIK